MTSLTDKLTVLADQIIVQSVSLVVLGGPLYPPGCMVVGQVSAWLTGEPRFTL